VVGGRIFCVHGGLSPHLKRLESINMIKRPITNSENKLICDLLWSDPTNKVDYWDANFERGISCIYGKKVIDEFVGQYDLDFICRSHQVVEEGYEFFNERKLLTIFSAPNYCGEFENMGGVLKISRQMVCHIELFKGTVSKLAFVKRAVTPMTKLERENKGAFDEVDEGNTYAGLKARKATRNILQSSEGSLKENVRPSMELFNKLQHRS
jgi:diadenosine tetraphosphatase ApaH/serine/threonine PP2A family protein phosphatase